MELPPGPGLGWWASGQEGQHRSHRGFCPTPAMHCNGETPGLEAAAQKAGMAHSGTRAASSRSVQVPSRCSANEPLPNGTPSPLELQGVSQSCQPGRHTGMDQGEPRIKEMERYLPGAGAPCCPRARQRWQQGPWARRNLVPAAAPRPGCGIQDYPAARLTCPGAGHIHNPRAGAMLELHVNRKSPLLRLRAVPAGTPAAAAQPGPQH